MSELSGYEVYYTNDSGSVSVAVPVTGGSTVNTVVGNLSSGSYYFSISAIDTNGLKSTLSTVASITFP
ncbi:MAG TPA: fibronectin type III domain-containing protein [Spongiibacteraceae bacterium]|nr:fibronectin type III domain-containing protein [Spongiibacteraceae bacterium]